MPAASYATATLAALLLFGGLHKHDSHKKYYEREERRQEKRRSGERAEHQKLVCYYKLEGSYSYRLQPEDIDPCLCTHVIVGFADVRDDLLVPRAADHLQAMKRVFKLKGGNKHIKILLSVGAVSGGTFSKMINYRRGRERFILSAIQFVDKYGFDGLDFDWEFPAWNGGPPSDRANFIQLLKEFRLVYGKGSKNFLLTLAVAARVPIIATSYDVPQLARLVDFVSLLSYDFHYFHPEFPYTYHQSALYSRPDSVGHHLTTSVDTAAKYWNLLGMPKKNIVIGIAMHAQTFTLTSSHSHGVGALSTGPGLGYGRLAFNKVCYFLKSGAARVFDIYSKVPYAYSGYQWMSFDDEESAAIKARYVRRNGYGGIMTYNLNNDDWNRSCDNTTFPIHRTIHSFFSFKKYCDDK